MNLHNSNRIEPFLLNYEILVRDLAEVAQDWPDLDDEERGHHRATLLQTWGNRRILGSLFKAHRLTPAQEARLSRLDHLLLEQSALMEQCYGLDLTQVLTIFRWGTPLARLVRPVRLEVSPISLDRMAAALIPSPAALQPAF